MQINPFKIKEYNTVSIRSRVKFIWNYYDELKLTVEAVEELIEAELEKHFKVTSIISWSHNLKIRINDTEKWIVKHINCAFKYDNTDIRYWNTKIDIITSELSKKPHLHFVWKFNILERDKIKQKVLADLISWLKEKN